MVSFSSLLLLHLTRLEGIIPKFFFLLSVSREKLNPHVGFPSVEKGATLLRRMVCGAPPSLCLFCGRKGVSKGWNIAPAVVVNFRF